MNQFESLELKPNITNYKVDNSVDKGLVKSASVDFNNGNDLKRHVDNDSFNEEQAKFIKTEKEESYVFRNTSSSNEEMESSDCVMDDEEDDEDEEEEEENENDEFEDEEEEEEGDGDEGDDEEEEDEEFESHSQNQSNNNIGEDNKIDVQNLTENNFKQE